MWGEGSWTVLLLTWSAIWSMEAFLHLLNAANESEKLKTQTKTWKLKHFGGTEPTCSFNGEYHCVSAEIWTSWSQHKSSLAQEPSGDGVINKTMFAGILLQKWALPWWILIQSSAAQKSKWKILVCILLIKTKQQPEEAFIKDYLL